MLISLAPLRDRRDRVMGYALSAYPAETRGAPLSPDDEARRTLEQIPQLSRMVGRSLLVPVTPALVRDGTMTRFASLDAVWLVASEALDDATTRRAMDRLIGSGLHFALQGFPEGEPLPPSLAGSAIVLDAARTPARLLERHVRALLEAGLRPLVRGVDDRATRHRVLSAGVLMYTGRQLTRGAAVAADRPTEDSILRAMAILAAFSDGRPPDGSFDSFVREDPHVAASLLKAISSAALGVRGPRSVSHAITLLGRDVIIERLVAVTARLIGEAAQDPELALAALRRARLCDRVGTALDAAPHPRARVVAGLLSTLEFALASPSPLIAQRLGLPPALRDVLDAREQPLGQLLDVVDAMEYGWWDDLVMRCRRLGIRPQVVADAWLETWKSSRDELGIARTDSF
ncbi:HDOD domain-containing protein [Gemmatimonas sp.]|jgi:c-di-GMP-related signal transduction protein|uniref:HDOD domain-containing protein n=1 Tax=Gemmatimonas sp. TaxID=1962908 RepID=UPI0022C29435|nr:HDOD domain-containing protein [Gemmatimonas sp.]MCZ8205952.1 HDOD domain-containing protein [Gemmatimonas sp.]